MWDLPGPGTEPVSPPWADGFLTTRSPGKPLPFFLDWIVFYVVSCISCLYILEIKPLSVTSLANIFSKSVSCLFVLFMVSFAVQNLIGLMRSHLFIFAHISIALGDWPKKILIWVVAGNVLLLFSSRSFMVSRLPFKSLNHFEFVFMHGMSVLPLGIYMWLSKFPNTICSRAYLLSIVYSYLICPRLIDYNMWVYFWAFNSIPLIHMSVFVPISFCFDYDSTYEDMLM